MRSVLLLLSAFAALLLFPPAPEAFGEEQESTCIQCHGGQPGRLGRPVKEWRGSIHERNGISCHSCHGGDPSLMSMEAMSPERGFVGVPREEAIPDFCGKCHVGVREDYLQSAHGQALGHGGPQCVTCHGNHAVQVATPELINPQDCSRCHEYGRAEEIRAAVAETDRTISALEQQLQGLHRTGVAVKELQNQLFAVRNEFHRLFHSVDVARVRGRTAHFQAELAQVRQQVETIRQRLDRRRLWGGGAVLLLAAGGVVALLLHRSYLPGHER